MTILLKTTTVIQFIGYFWVALVGLVVDFGVLTISSELFDLHYLAAAALGFTFGLICVYLLSERFVFSNPKIKSKTLNFLIFGAIGVIGLIILSLMMWLFTDIMNLHYLISKTFSTVFVYAWNFFARKSLYRN